MSFILYKKLNLDICIFIDKYIQYYENYNKTLNELINIFNKSKILIKKHNTSIIERNSSSNLRRTSQQISQQTFNKSYYLRPEFNYYIRERNNILLIYRLIVSNYMYL